MTATLRVTAWICIVSTSFFGCTSTTLIQPEAGVGEERYAGQIEGVVTKEGVQYEFEGATGTMYGGMVRGISAGKPIAIPLSDVDKVLVRESDTGRTILLVVVLSAVALVALIAVVKVGSQTGGGSLGLEGK